jgi:capsular exopolysaccharide synthesis family protein
MHALDPQARPGNVAAVADDKAMSGSESTFSLSDLRKLFLKRKWIILACILAGVGVALYHVETAIPQYEAVASVSIDMNKSTGVELTSLASGSGGLQTQDRVETQLHIMQSDTIAWNVIESLKLYNKPPYSKVFKKTGYHGTVAPWQKLALLNMFKGATQVVLVPETDLAEIHFQNQDPKVAQEAANEIVSAYQDWTLSAHFETMTRISNWLSQQIVSLRESVNKSQSDLVQYQREHNLLSIGRNGTSLVDTDLETVNGQLAQAEADRIVKEARYKMALTRNPDLLVSVAPNTVLTSLRSQQANLLVQQADLQSKFGPRYPKLEEVRQQLKQVHADIDKEITNLTLRFKAEYDAAVQTQNLLEARLNSTKQQAFKQNESSAQFEILKHKAQTSSELYDALQLRLEEAGITAGLNSNSLEVVDTANLPVIPVTPQKKRTVVFGFLGGLIAGIAISLLLESLDDTLRTSEEVESIGHLPALAIVPRFVSGAKRRMAYGSYGAEKRPKEPAPGKEDQVSRDLLTLLEPQSIVAEGFRTLRSSILLSSVDREPKAILLTSGLAAEGKSTCAANLAISFAQRPARVLLVDTDLRKGTQHLKFRVSNRIGLSTYLSRESGEESIVFPIPELPNLGVLPRGPVAPNPGEMLASRMMADTIHKWRTEWDFIIFDTSPVLAVSDTLNLVQHMDGTLVVVRSGITRKKALQRTRELLRRASARILGSVVNGVDMRLENYYTYSRGYSYGYRSGYESSYGAGYGVEDTDEKS